MSIKSFIRSSVSSSVVYSTAVAGNTKVNSTFLTDYLLVGGGGGGNSGNSSYADSAGGGAGGYLNSYGSEASGGNSPSLDAKTMSLENQYYVEVGAGGAVNAKGGDTKFDNLIAYGGGFGGRGGQQGGAGGSGGGGGYLNNYETTPPGSATYLQGNVGGPWARYRYSNFWYGPGGPGGGGAGEPGKNGYYGRSDVSTNEAHGGGRGGNGLYSSITGSSVGRAGGGGGWGYQPHTGHNTVFGGGVGAFAYGPGGDSSAGEQNKGGGGGAGYTYMKNASSGGSGIVILRYPNSFSAVLGAGLTGNSYISGGSRVTEITAGAGHINWEAA